MIIFSQRWCQVLIVSFLAVFAVSQVYADRGRVKIKNNNVVADNNKTLRGAPFFLDIFSVADMRNNENTYKNYFKSVATNYNMNLVRCAPWIGNWEYMNKGSQYYDNHKKDITYLLDKCVQWAGEVGIYAMVNMHIKFGTKVNVQKAKDFWNVFAPRYKNRTHVLYELVNEPDIPTVKSNMATIYKHVRGKAPNTHLVLWSLQDPQKISTNQIWNNSNGISYKNASVGWHSYETIFGKKLRWDLARDYRENGLPVINTEFYSLTRADFYPIDYKYLVDNIRIGESQGHSWTQWAPVFNHKNTNQKLSHNDVKFTQNYKNRVKNGYNGIKGIGFYWGRDTSSANNTANPPAPQPTNDTGAIAGNKRVKDASKGRYLHASGTANYAVMKSAPLNKNWSSQKWKFERVSGNNYRIKNGWSGKYLSVPSKASWSNVQASTLNKGWTSQQWLIEKVGNQYRMKNLWSGLYLHTPAGNWSDMKQAPLNKNSAAQKYNLEAF